MYPKCEAELDNSQRCRDGNKEHTLCGTTLKFSQREAWPIDKFSEI